MSQNMNGGSQCSHGSRVNGTADPLKQQNEGECGSRLEECSAFIDIYSTRLFFRGAAEKVWLFQTCPEFF